MEQSYRTYITVSGDTWDWISYQVYGKEHYVPELIKANPELSGIAIFPSNVYVRCPEIEANKAGELPVWAI